MKFDVRVKQLLDGAWQARYIGGKVEALSSRGDSKTAALDKLRDDIRYHLEFCP